MSDAIAKAVNGVLHEAGVGKETIDDISNFLAEHGKGVAIGSAAAPVVGAITGAAIAPKGKRLNWAGKGAGIGGVAGVGAMLAQSAAQHASLNETTQEKYRRLIRQISSAYDSTTGAAGKAVQGAYDDTVGAADKAVQGAYDDTVGAAGKAVQGGLDSTRQAMTNITTRASKGLDVLMSLITGKAPIPAQE
jgi:hypothetical protein